MHKFFVILFLSGLTVFAEDSAIRSFPIPTIEKLGRDLYVQDNMAARAFDALFAVYPKAEEQPIRGWITDLAKRCVYLIEKQESGLDVAYTVTFSEGGEGEPKVENQHGAPLPEAVAKRYAARQAAIEATPRVADVRYNFEVLDAPDGKGYLVYALASTTDPNEVVVGGHSRVTVSEDGKVEQIDALSRSFLVFKKNASDIPKGSTLEAFSMSHVVSDTPVETHVFVNLLHGIPLVVATSKSDIWEIKDGTITKMDPKELQEQK